MADADLKHAVLWELEQDPQLDTSDLLVNVTGKDVTLSGTVSSWRCRLAAHEAARRVPGVRRIINDIVFSAPDHGGGDADIARTVRAALDGTFPAAEAAAIAASVATGWVTLEGELDGWTKRVRAEAAIANLAGVRGVVNSIVIAPVVRTALPVMPAGNAEYPR